MIEIGNYVRTRKGIAKIKEKIGEIWDRGIAYEVDKNGTVITDASFNEFIYKKDIIKHSKNIIDLIEEGDYVNGYKVCEINKNRIGFEGCRRSKSYYYFEDNNFEIKSIVTKEMFASMEYKIKD